MVHQYHRDILTYFEHQRRTTADYIIPFIERSLPIAEGCRVLEIGCAEGGVLKAFAERGCQCAGVELDETRYERALSLLREEIQEKRVTLIRKDIYAADIDKDLGGPFDLIILKDVIEHIHDQERLLRELPRFLRPGGAIFISFPPWQMPYGGHQQVSRNRLLAVMPYYHLLPRFLYRVILKAFGEKEIRIAELMEVKETGITLERLQRLLRRTGYDIAGRTLYLINPIYRFKLGLRPRQQLGLIAALPYVRNFLTTCGYYLAKPTPD
jgi:2-polyprenyl-3-methyl-5-hydroxy-6-metoxy-1,4-benzoquinol methylase